MDDSALQDQFASMNLSSPQAWGKYSTPLKVIFTIITNPTYNHDMQGIFLLFPNF